MTRLGYEIDELKVYPDVRIDLTGIKEEGDKLKQKVNEKAFNYKTAVSEMYSSNTYQIKYSSDNICRIF